MNLRLFLVAVLLLASSWAGTPNPAPQALDPKARNPSGVSTVFSATVVRVKDGDTLVADINLGLFVSIHESLRLLDVEAPEVTGPKAKTEGPAGRKVKEFLQARLSDGEAIVIRATKRDKYGRVLAEVWDEDGDVNAALREYIAALSD